MKKLFVLVPVLALLATSAMAEKKIQKEYPILKATITMSSDTDPELCIKVNEIISLFQDTSGSEVCIPTSQVKDDMVIVNESNNRTLVRITTTSGAYYGVHYITPEVNLIIVRSVAIREEWLACLYAAQPYPDVVPVIIKKN